MCVCVCSHSHMYDMESSGNNYSHAECTPGLGHVLTHTNCTTKTSHYTCMCARTLVLCYAFLFWLRICTNAFFFSSFTEAFLLLNLSSNLISFFLFFFFSPPFIPSYYIPSFQPFLPCCSCVSGGLFLALTCFSFKFPSGFLPPRIFSPPF